ncbi:hypothetical protein KIW84_055758 [Lathyrus oleraceus]|uniref:Ubiquitin-like protease family profile domain-containing protein n=1 Tax=Pisum sativum TaxID=3888 RepID=A0A9D5AK68_PEA|nr:hypothetical protein KIW84_055758 [Pisum sativum]
MASSSSSSATILKFFFVFVVLAAMTSAQDLGLSPVSAPGPDAGAAGYITNSMAMTPTRPTHKAGKGISRRIESVASQKEVPGRKLKKAGNDIPTTSGTKSQIMMRLEKMVEESDIMHGAIRSVDFDEGVFGIAHSEIIAKEDMQQLFEHEELGIAVIHTYIWYINGGHWVLVAMDLSRLMVYYLDSLSVTRLERDVTRPGSSSTRDEGGRGGALEASADTTSTCYWTVDRVTLDAIMHNKSDNKYVRGRD